MDFNGEIVFAISDSNSLDVNFASIFLPTKIVNKGDVIVLGRKAPKNRWLHVVEFDNRNEYLEKFERLTNQLYEQVEYICQLKKIYEEVSFDVYIRSNFAQIGYSLPSDIIKKLALIDCEVNFEILSFGMAINEE